MSANSTTKPTPRSGGEWWRSAVIYQVYPRSFADASGDGMGDLPGITSRLPALAELGVDAIWLSPFFPSPQKDAGYDVSDYCDVDPRFGTLADFQELESAAHALGLRLIVDLVPNHTSDQHRWFLEALASQEGSDGARPVHLPRRPGAERRPPAEQLGIRLRRRRLDPGDSARRHATGSGTCTCSTPPSRTSTGTTRGCASSSAAS